MGEREDSFSKPDRETVKMNRVNVREVKRERIHGVRKLLSQLLVSVFVKVVKLSL